MHDYKLLPNIRVVTQQNSKFLLLLLQSLFVLSQITYVSLTNLNKISEFLHRRQSSSLAGLLYAHTHPLVKKCIYFTNHQKKAYNIISVLCIRTECTSYSDCFYTSTRYTNKRSSFGGRKSEKVKVNGFVVWYGMENWVRKITQPSTSASTQCLCIFYVDIYVRCTCYGYHEHYKATGDTLVIPKVYTKKQTTALLFHIFYVAKIDDKYVYLEKNVLFS